MNVRLFPSKLLKTGLFLFALTGILLFSSSACEKDKEDYTTDITIYQTLCPSGIQACYTDCGDQYDQDGDGAVEASQLYAFDTCISGCDNHCDLSFLYLYLLSD